MKKVWKLIRRIFLWLFISQLAYIIIVWFVNPPITITQIGSLLQGNGLRRDYVPLEKISANMRLAVIASEDQNFPTHNGFDWKQIEKAIDYNETHETKMRGGSTISQQVAKNVFLWQGRSYFRKGLEVYFTFMIELLYSKRRILELYLNVIETGKGVFGAEAAAQACFKKSASKLSAREAAMLAASLPNPKRFTVKPVSARVSSRTPWVMRQMKQIRGSEELEKLLQ